MLNKRRREKGFTLAEILVVVCIMLILLGMMTPSYYQYQASRRVRSAISATLVLKTALNDTANSCKGFPKRSSTGTDNASLLEFLSIVDLTECGRTDDINETAIKVFPTGSDCSHTAIAQTVMPSHPYSTNFNASGLCSSVCDRSDSGCSGKAGAGVGGVFIRDDIAADSRFEACSPEYSGVSGPDYSGNYKPGWNYALLSGFELDKPVGVVCSVAMGYKRSVLIVVNTSGFYDGQDVAEGSGMYDIDGDDLDEPCPCGPYCEELFESSGDGQSGCCSPCVGADGTKYSGIGYKF
jgi:prepilin-type N-terminal cleavage/methylation domain-containing protein